MATEITEEMGVHEKWYEARPTLAELPEFLRHLTEDYEHDYGTICHAVAAGALASARAIDKSPQGGITGFQAGAIMWQFICKWQHLEGKPLRLLEYENMLYPQYESKFKTISKSTWKWLQAEATKNIQTSLQAHPQVVEHWKKVADGIVPFDFKVED